MICRIPAAFVSVVLWFVTAIGGANAQSISLAQDFDARDLTRQEVQIVQAALAHYGTYDALLDGAWGGGSQRALETYVTRERGGDGPDFDDVRALLRGFERERRLGGWAPVYHARAQVGHLLPLGRLTRSDTPEETRYATSDGGLVIVKRSGFVRPYDLHDAIEADSQPGTTPYRTESDRRIITAARMRGGRDAYVRSDRDDGGWETHIVIADAAHADDLRLIASSFQRAPAVELTPPAGGTLDALLHADGGRLPVPERPRPPEPRAPEREASFEELLVGLMGSVLAETLRRESDRDRDEDDREDSEAERLRELARERERSRGAASGFYVNTTDIVTSAQVVGACERLELVDGTSLSVIGRDDAAGVAVLAAPGRSAHWLPVSPRAAERGAQVRLLSRAGLEGARVAARDGRILGDADRRGRLRHDVRIAPRGDGGPFLSSDGRVIGVALPPSGAAEDGGTLLRDDALRGRLDAFGVPYSDGHTRRTTLTRDTPRALSRAVVAIRCDG
ncbi:serine protease [Jannaschia sp. S6380]|uniref:S1 family peptidase n=1 Tax=Jannaschia sp. S6380 TaxID=2926408 RepID=UPI001FF59B1B|nr:serine protease [Jannaschia sp. S6380]MCK0168116.1 serine protease [Jannaschia sp. S6380]